MRGEGASGAGRRGQVREPGLQSGGAATGLQNTLGRYS